MTGSNTFLGEVVEDITVGHVGSMANEYVDNGVPFLRSLNVESLNIKTNDLKYITSEFHARLKKSQLHPGDVVVVRTGKPGAAVVIPDWLNEANCSDLVIIRPGKRVNPHWLAYFINYEGAHHVASHLVGAVQQHFNVESARKMPVRLPTLEEQAVVANALRAFDEKIELNRKMNETLEQMARAIFKSWFIDFDPVRAKAEGKKPFGMDDATAALFPDSFERSELGEIPKGWFVTSLSSLASIKHGYAFQGEYFSDKPTELVLMTPGNFAVGGGFKADKLKYYNGPYSEEYVLKEGDLIVTMTDLSKAGDTLGYGAFVSQLQGNKKALHNQRVGRVFPLGSVDDAQYLYQTFCSHTYRNHVLGSATGSTVKHTSPTRILEFKISCPSEQLRHAFALIVAEFYKMQRANIKEIVALSEIRDLLLPRLLSGDISLEELP